VREEGLHRPGRDLLRPPTARHHQLAPAQKAATFSPEEARGNARFLPRILTWSGGARAGRARSRAARWAPWRRRQRRGRRRGRI
jgi:hypothetical protein